MRTHPAQSEAGLEDRPVEDRANRIRAFVALVDLPGQQKAQGGNEVKARDECAPEGEHHHECHGTEHFPLDALGA